MHMDAPSRSPTILDRVRGYKTHLAAFIGSQLVPVIVVKLEALGIQLTTEEKIGMATAIMGGLMMLMRLVTNVTSGIATRAATGKPVRLTSENYLHHVDMKLLARMVLADIVRLRTKDKSQPAPSKETTNG